MPEQDQHELKPSIKIALDIESAKALYDMLKILQGVSDLLGNVQVAYNAHSMAIDLKKAIDDMILSKNMTNRRRETNEENTPSPGPFAPGTK